MRLEKLKPLIIMAVIGLLIFAALKWFGRTANDDLSGYDGGRGKYETSITEMQ